MILQLHKEPLEVGSRHVGCNGKDGIWHPDQPYVLLREATVDEYRAWCFSEGVPSRSVESQIKKFPSDRYFEVSID